MRTMLLVFFVALNINAQQRIDASKISSENLKMFNVETDKFTKALIINSKRVGDIIEPSIFVYDDIIMMKIRVSYYGQTWIYMDNIQFLVNDDVFGFDTGVTDKIIRNNGTVLEVADIIVTDDILEQLRRLKSSKDKTFIRLQGKSYSDRRLYAPEILKIMETVNLYDLIVRKYSLE